MRTKAKYLNKILQFVTTYSSQNVLREIHKYFKFTLLDYELKC